MLGLGVLREFNCVQQEGFCMIVVLLNNCFLALQLSTRAKKPMEFLTMTSRQLISIFIARVSRVLAMV